MSDWKLGKPAPEDEPGYIGKAKISKLETLTGKAIFGDKAQNADDQFLCIYVHRRDKDVKIDQIHLFRDMSNLHPKSKAGQFMHAYGCTPKVGMQVNVKTNGDGFWELVL
jgi:hypothetical protein